MEIIIPDETTAIAELAADAVCALIDRKPDAVIGLATGSSPLPLYAELIRRYKAGEVSFSRATAFTLDEYVGLPKDHPEAYANVIRNEFTDHVDFADGAVHYLDGLAPDLAAQCVTYEEEIARAGGVDLQILGIGTSGHIAFNEPSSSFASRTRVKSLMPQTRQDNARFFDGDLDQVPVYCLTQGLGTIMEARHVVLIAYGQGKADAVRRLVEGPVSSMCPASILQHHPHVSILVDGEAGGELEHRDYYRSAWKNKPQWQGL